MALNIEGATFGFDANGVQEALNNINTNVIQEAVDQMNNSMNDLRSWVDSAWVGESAEQFKKNMEADKRMITSQLDQSFNALQSVIRDQIGGTIAEADANLVKAREE